MTLSQTTSLIFQCTDYIDRILRIMNIRNDMPQFRRHDIEYCSTNNKDSRIEVLAVEVTINKEKWLFISMYKQPKVKASIIIYCVDNIMNHCINFDCSIVIMGGIHFDCNIVIMGDLNVNMLKRNNALTNCLDINGLTNIVKNATCFKGTPSLIDFIVTNKPKRFKSTISADTGLSDIHSMVCTSTKFHVPKQKLTTFTYRSYKHFNNESFLSDLSVIPYHITENI